MAKSNGTSIVTAGGRDLGRILARAPVATFELDTAGSCVHMTDHWLRMTGQTIDQAAAAGWLAAFDISDRDRLSQLWRRAAQSDAIVEADATLRAPGGAAAATVLVRLVADRDPAGRVLRYVGAITDIDRFKHEHGRDFADPTAIRNPNHALLLAQLADRLARSRERGLVCAVHHLDLDHFRDINEAAGHAIGDLVLQLIGERLSACMQAKDCVVRYENDEFVVLQCDLPGTSDAMLMADRLMRVVSQPVIVGGKRLYLTASVGTCIPKASEHDIETILQHAELALHRAKDEGNNTFRLFETQLDQQVQKRASLATDLKAAIASDQGLFLVYQPQIALDTGELTGVEALVRWQHPSLGQLMPADFIPAAEKSGIMRMLGFWVLNTALRQGSKWLQDSASVPMLTVNLSGIEARAPTLEFDIAAALLASGFPAERLELDISETTFLEATRSESRLFANLRRLGVHFAIDDFGKSYTSLKHLRLFPIGRLKIAGEFVKNTDHDRDNAAIIESAIALARSLGHHVVAEGVETAADADFLRIKGCEAGQGFFFAPPMAAPEIEPLLRQSRRGAAPALVADASTSIEKGTAAIAAQRELFEEPQRQRSAG